MLSRPNLPLFTALVLVFSVHAVSSQNGAKDRRTSDALVLQTSIRPSNKPALLEENDNATSLFVNSNSSATCNKYQWKCQGRDGACIDISKRCDNVLDCSDASDEFGCRECDLSRFFRCRNGECLTKLFVCDGSPDCADQSDEQHCNEAEDECAFGNFRCKDGNCIPGSWKCDGRGDCIDHSDEEGCSAKCTDKEFRCRNEICIPTSFVCDGELDCKDGDDEENCAASRCSSNPDHYQCRNGKCIGLENVCNGLKNCDDGSDEGGLCSRVCKLDDCSHKCYNTPSGPHCVCPKGYYLTSDEKSCIDVNECLGNVSVCDHFCENLVGGFKCSCAPDYKLDADNKTCLSIRRGQGFLLIAKNREIRELLLSSETYTLIYHGEKPIKCVAYDPVEDRVYWSEGVAVFQKKRRHEEMAHLVIKEGIRQVESLAVDWYGRNLYIADSGSQKIIVCTLTGLHCKALIENVHGPGDLQLDIRERLIFWTDSSNQKIEKAGMDGTQRRILVSGFIPIGLAVDQPAKRVYWMNVNQSTVEHVDYSGNDRKHLPDGAISQPTSMAVWENKIYWSDLKHEHIQSCNKQNGKNVDVLLKGSSNDFNEILLHHPSMIYQGQHPCLNKPCSHICLLSPRNRMGYTCACPAELVHSDYMHICKGKTGVSFPLIADGNKFYKMVRRLIGQTTIVPWPVNYQFERIGDVDYDPVEESLIVSDTYAKEIVKISVDTGRVHRLISNVNAVGVAVDWLRNNIYWVDGVKRVVEVVTKYGLYRRFLESNFYNPTDIAVVPADGFLFVTDAGAVPFIMRCGLDGSNCTRIITTGLSQPIFITTAMEDKMYKIYWCDLEAGLIEKSALDGSGRITLKTGVRRPNSLMVADRQLSWSLEGSNRVFMHSQLTNETAPLDLSLKTADYGIRALQLYNVGWLRNVTREGHPCSYGNVICNQLCLGNSTHKQVCSCGIDFELAQNGFACVPRNCRDDQFLCPRNKSCIPSNWRCDGTKDCEDGGDEEGCSISHRTCKSEEFRCKSGNCINKVWLCDGYSDCQDGSDENVPQCKNASCRSNQFQCKSGECIPSMWRCDRIKECSDGSDEDGCPLVCPEHKFPCSDGNCIPDMWHCDGDADCNDGSDEQNCDGIELKSRSDAQCNVSEITCASKEGSVICVPESKRCDGEMDCPYGEDENCTKCEASQFKCISGDMCIPDLWLCDGIEDCADGSDEKQNCTEITTVIPPSTTASTTTSRSSHWRCNIHEFQCENGQCITGTKVCDGRADCGDGSDEWNHCYQSCGNDNGGCQHKCHSSPDGVYCSCNKGFYLDVDKSSCLDVKECDNEATCSHYCAEMKGSYMCVCMGGYALEPDRRSCKPKDSKEWAILIGSGTLLNMSLSLDMTSKIPVVKNVPFSSIVYDPRNDAIIYTDVDKGNVGMAVMTGENDMTKGEKVFSNRSNPQGISLDQATGNIYFSEYFVDPLTVESQAKNDEGIVKRDQTEPKNVFSVIQVCDFENLQCKQIYRASDVMIPSTQVSSDYRKLFYCINYLSSKDQAEMLMSDLDGGSPENLHRNKMVRCGSLSIDEPKKKVYWTDLVLNTIECIAWESKIHTIFKKNEAHFPVGLALSGDWVMWFNQRGNQLVRCHKYQNICEKRLLSQEERSSTFKTGAFLVTHPLRKYENKCAANNCSQLCTVVNDEAKCMCQLGYSESKEDPTMCLEVDMCSDNPCVRGKCELLSSNRFVCRCPVSHTGLRCEVQIGLVELASNTGTVVTIVITLLLIIAIVLGFIFYKKQPFIIWKTIGRRANQTYRFSNPAFGVMSDTPIMTNSPAPSSCPSQGNNPSSHAMVNPKQPHNNFENPFFKAEEHQINTSSDSAVASGTDSTSINIAPHQISLDSPCLVPEEQQTELKKEWMLSPYNPPPR